MDVWCAHDLAWKARFMAKYPDGLDPIIAILRDQEQADAALATLRAEKDAIGKAASDVAMDLGRRLREAVAERDTLRDENVALRDNNAAVKALFDERAQEIATLRAQLASSSAWRDIATAPKDGTEILLGAYYGKWWLRGFGRFVPPAPGHGGYWRSGEGITEPTHWMPLHDTPGSSASPAEMRTSETKNA